MLASSLATARRRSAVAALSCALCLGVAAPMALATTDVTPAAASAQDLLAGLVNDGTLTWAPGAAGAASTLPPLGSAGTPTIVIVTPGTDDTGLHPRVDGLVGPREAAYVNYPQSFGPFVSGKADPPLGLPFLAPGYQSSAAIATAGNLDVMKALVGYGGPVLYTGFSQGAEALGDAAEQGVASGVLDDNSVILLVSDPRSPWGLKGWAADLPASGVWLSPILGVLDIDNNGARDPGKTGDVPVVAVIVAGDPVADWQFKWYRPASSLLVNAAGFLVIHAPGDGPYGNLDKLGEPTVMTSEDGNTTYLVYDTEHPLALLNAAIYDVLGLEYDDEDLRRWDRNAELFYAMETPGVGNTRDGVRVKAEQPAAVPAVADTTVASRTSVDGAAAKSAEPVVEYQGRHRAESSPEVSEAPSDYTGRHRAEPTPQAAPEAPTTSGSDTSDITPAAPAASETLESTGSSTELE
ncbi:PE-PPE domain-containing protein [Gordonia phosphorivorans]|uniref:PE-PPE domain-containing protein n=1 Tax=Gordonia phosphorivorans TaxID=1056982 RepID=A0ABV6HBN2_9ACTN